MSSYFHNINENICHIKDAANTITIDENLHALDLVLEERDNQADVLNFPR